MPCSCTIEHMSNPTHFIEMFPVRVEALPRLHAYRPTDPAAATPRTASKLARTFEGRWAWADGLVLTDNAPRKNKFDPATEHLEKVSRYKPSPIAQAGYLIHALVPPLADTLAQALQTPLQVNFRLLLEPTFKAWAVDGDPAVSIGIMQRLIYRQDLAEYAATIPNEQGLVGMTVVSRVPWVDGRLLSGGVVGLNGTLGDQRDTLKRFARSDDAQKRLDRAPDSEPVVKVRTFYGDYDFPAHALYIALGAKDYARLRIDADAAQKASYPNIADRARSVAAASAVLKALDYIGDSYKSNETAGRFFNAASLSFTAHIQLGDKTPRPYHPAKLWDGVSDVGLFQQPQVQRPVRIGIINALGEAAPNSFEERLVAALKAIQIPVANVQGVVTSGLTPDEAAAAFKQLTKPDAVIVYIPGSEPTAYSMADDWAAYVNIKREVIGAGLQSLCVFEDDMRPRTAPQEFALAFALAVGYTPFVLGEPLPFVDFVIGLTVVRGDTDTFVELLYDAGGVLLGYSLQSGKLADVLARLLPPDFFAGRRVILQHVDKLTDDEAAALRGYAAQHAIHLHLCAVGTAANPRLYTFTDKGIVQPPTGTVFKLDGSRALLIPALPAHPAQPPNPLLIESVDGLSAEDAARAVLEMNMLHPQAKKPRLPITLHHGERISQLVKAGVKPLSAEGVLPWWL